MRLQEILLVLTGAEHALEGLSVANGIDWTDDRKSIAEAIPPDYTEHIGRQLMAHLKAQEVAA